MALPAWVDPDEPKPAPPPLLVVQAFLNTLDIGHGTDVLADGESARRWLTTAGLIEPEAVLRRGDLASTRDFREGLRALLVSNGGGPCPTADELRPLRQLASRRQPRLSVDESGRLRLGAGPSGDVRDALLGLLLTVYDAQADGTWGRLKVCANPDCRWAFFDRSRNRQGTWCEMAACGNRIKNRHLRARRR